MTLNLGQVLIKAYRELGEMHAGVATGGSTTSVVDSALANVYKDDTWKGGTVFILRDTAGAGGAPENEFLKIASFAVDTGTFNTTGSWSAATASGDTYGFVGSFYPIHMAIQLVNDALRELGDVPLRDTTTIVGVSGQTEYGTSVSWKRRPPYQIDIQGRTDASFDNQWRMILPNQWYYEPGAAGAAGRIVFRSYLPADYDVQVWYQDAHPVVNDYDDYINEIFDPELVSLAVKKKMLEWKNGQLRGSDQYMLQKLNTVTSELNNRMVTHRPWRPRKKNNLLITRNIMHDWGDEFTVPGPP